MRIWHEQLIPKLCQKHLCGFWREALGAYKIITEFRTDLAYYKHPATQEFVNCPEVLWNRLKLVREEALKRGYNFKELPKYVEFGGTVNEWQPLEEQIQILHNKGCNCKI